MSLINMSILPIDDEIIEKVVKKIKEQTIILEKQQNIDKKIQQNIKESIKTIINNNTHYCINLNFHSYFDENTKIFKTKDYLNIDLSSCIYSVLTENNMMEKYNSYGFTKDEYYLDNLNKYCNNLKDKIILSDERKNIINYDNFDIFKRFTIINKNDINISNISYCEEYPKSLIASYNEIEESIEERKIFNDSITTKKYIYETHIVQITILMDYNIDKNLLNNDLNMVDSFKNIYKEHYHENLYNYIENIIRSSSNIIILKKSIAETNEKLKVSFNIYNKKINKHIIENFLGNKILFTIDNIYTFDELKYKIVIQSKIENYELSLSIQTENHIDKQSHSYL